jgi:hypothetical protein
MKNVKALLIIVSLVVLSMSASAQRGGHYYGGGHYYHSYSPRVIVSPSFGYGYGYYPYSYFGMPFFGYPYGYASPYGYGSRGSYNLSLQIQSIKIDYRNQIRNTRKDKSISHAERRKDIRNLKTERDQAIISAQRNYRSGRRNNQNSNGGYINPNSGSNNGYQNNNNSSGG